MKDCNNIRPLTGCWAKADGTYESVGIHYVYGLNLLLRRVLLRTVYTNADGDPVIVPGTDNVTLGACELNTQIVENVVCINGEPCNAFVTINKTTLQPIKTVLADTYAEVINPVFAKNCDCGNTGNGINAPALGNPAAGILDVDNAQVGCDPLVPFNLQIRNSSNTAPLNWQAVIRDRQFDEVINLQASGPFTLVVVQNASELFDFYFSGTLGAFGRIEFRGEAPTLNSCPDNVELYIL